MGDIPLRRLREKLVADFCEIALLPAAAVDERNIVFRESDQRVRFGKIGNDGVRMLAPCDYVSYSIPPYLLMELP